MHPPTKDQTDIGIEDSTIDASDGADIKDFDKPNKDVARQEFKADADINVYLSKLGITQARDAPQYGEWDDTIDLQTSIQALRDAREAFDRLPKELTSMFPNMEALLNAINNGTLVLKDEEAPPEQPTEAQLIQQRLDNLEKFHQTTAPRQQEL